MKQYLRIVPSPIYPRLLGYAVSLAMHVVNVDNMVNSFTGDELKNADVSRFHDDQLKFLTVWNVYAQIFYAAIGLSCDILVLANKGKDRLLLKSLKKIRDPIFSSMICPMSLTVSFVFWTVVSYDRSLILPPRVDQTIGWTSNHVIHTAIVPVVLWEIAFRPRRGPESHVLNLVLMYSYATGYLAVLVNSYLNNGTWIYPILNLLNGTVYLYIFLGISVIVVQAFYCLQWYLTDLVWGSREDIKKVN